MNTNTKQFLTLVEKATAAGKETSLKRIVNGFISEGFSLENPIIIEYSKKHFKPLDFESYFTEENNINKLYFITVVKENENINFYSFVYSYKFLIFFNHFFYCFHNKSSFLFLIMQWIRRFLLRILHQTLQQILRKIPT